MNQKMVVAIIILLGVLALSGETVVTYKLFSSIDETKKAHCICQPSNAIVYDVVDKDGRVIGQISAEELREGGIR